MNSLERWWSRRSDSERLAVIIIGGVAVLAIVGGIVYAIATGGIVVTVGGMTIFMGPATAGAPDLGVARRERAAG